MVLGFIKKFPNGEPTDFKKKILEDVKIHSFRGDPNDRWKAGNSIQMAHGVRTAHYEQFNKYREDLSTCKGTQRVSMTFVFELEVSIDGRFLSGNEVLVMIANDGVTVEQFCRWFFPKGKTVWVGKIIHWTDHRY